MTSSLETLAPWLVAGAASFAAAIVLVTGVRTWRAWRQLRVTRAAARALVAVHAERVDRSIDEAIRRSGALAEGGESLATSLLQLRRDVDQLRWLLDAVPDQRARLRDELVAIAVPRRGHAGGDDG